MDMTGEYRIPASRDQVWAALNDPETLKASLPGCESLEKVSEHEFVATVVAKVGPVKAKFNGNVALSNLNPPESYTISGEGKGGAAGFAKGGADVRLAEMGDITILTYTAKADVGGKLAQLGSRLIDGTAKKMADEFFDNFTKQVAAPVPAAAPEAPAEPMPAPALPAESLLQNKFVWAAVAIVVLMILVLLFR
jgi:carbon monoxide dehydrogenase subunit G